MFVHVTHPPGVLSYSVEYAHNSLSTSATGMSPFMDMYGFQSPLFLSQEDEVSVPSVQEHLRWVRRVWRKARAALIRSAPRNRRMADRRRSPTPDYQPGQMVWLSTKDLPLQVDSRKLDPRYIGPFKVVKIINPTP